MSSGPARGAQGSPPSAASPSRRASRKAWSSWAANWSTPSDSPTTTASRQQEILNVINRSKKRQATFIITTQKDAVRFPKIDRRDLPFYFMRVEIKIISGANDFQDCVRQICFR